MMSRRGWRISRRRDCRDIGTRRAPRGTVRRDPRSRPMHETKSQLVETSFRIAWDYLEGAGELEDYHMAARLLLDVIEP